MIGRSGRGVPCCVFQDEKKGKKAEEARGTLKAAVLKGDSKSCDLVVVSNYDQKPFYILSHSIPKITWVIKTKTLWSRKLRKNVPFQFLRCNVSDDYNLEMNDNDWADALRLNYRIMRMQRNTKWWWALWLWALETIMTCAYRMYVRYCQLTGHQIRWNHHDFLECIGRAFVDPSTWPGRTGSLKSPPEKRQKQQSPEKRSVRFSSKALEADGALCGRLDSSLNHMVVPPSAGRSIPCQLHCWAQREKKRQKLERAGKKIDGDALKMDPPPGSRGKDVIHCKLCNVNLCVRC